MTEIQNSSGGRQRARLLLEDLACVDGALSEIMTAWRRARPWEPGLRFSILTTLQDTARRLAADIAADARGSLRRDPALSVMARFSALEQAIADTRGVPGAPEVGDRGLWELLGAAMQRAEAQLAPSAG